MCVCVCVFIYISISMSVSVSVFDAIKTHPTGPRDAKLFRVCQATLFTWMATPNNISPMPTPSDTQALDAWHEHFDPKPTPSAAPRLPPALTAINTKVGIIKSTLTDYKINVDVPKGYEDKEMVTHTTPANNTASLPRAHQHMPTSAHVHPYVRPCAHTCSSTHPILYGHALTPVRTRTHAHIRS